MPMNVNEGMHNPGVPFFPVSTIIVYLECQLLISMILATRTTDDESGKNQKFILDVKKTPELCSFFSIHVIQMHLHVHLCACLLNQIIQ